MDLTRPGQLYKHRHALSIAMFAQVFHPGEMDCDCLAFRAKVRQLSIASAVFDQPDIDFCLKCSDCARRFQCGKFRCILRENNTQPALFCCMSDGWGATVRSTQNLHCCGSHLSVTRKGRFRHEFLLQFGILRVLSLDSSIAETFVVEEPLGLNRGKSAWNIFAAACEWPTLRACGHQGICLNMHVQDGLMHVALRRLFFGRLELYYDSLGDSGDGAQTFLLRITDWCVLVSVVLLIAVLLL